MTTVGQEVASPSRTEVGEVDSFSTKRGSTNGRNGHGGQTADTSRRMTQRRPPGRDTTLPSIGRIRQVALVRHPNRMEEGRFVSILIEQDFLTRGREQLIRRTPGMARFDEVLEHLQREKVHLENRDLLFWNGGSDDRVSSVSFRKNKATGVLEPHYERLSKNIKTRIYSYHYDVVLF